MACLTIAIGSPYAGDTCSLSDCNQVARPSTAQQVVNDQPTAHGLQYHAGIAQFPILQCASQAACHGPFDETSHQLISQHHANECQQ